MSGTPLTDAIEALTTYSNTVTGASDTTLSEAVATLAAGYGGGGGNLLYSWDFTQSLTDTVKGAVASLHNGCARDSSGVHFTDASQFVGFDRAFTGVDVTYEIDIATMDRQGTDHGRVFMLSGTEGFIYRSTGAWGVYRGSWSMSSVTDANYFSGSTLKVVYNTHGVPSFYKNNTPVMSATGTPWSGMFSLGASGNSFYNMTITGLRIYKGDTTQ